MRTKLSGMLFQLPLFYSSWVVEFVICTEEATKGGAPIKHVNLPSRKCTALPADPWLFRRFQEAQKNYAGVVSSDKTSPNTTRNIYTSTISEKTVSSTNIGTRKKHFVYRPFYDAPPCNYAWRRFQGAHPSTQPCGFELHINSTRFQRDIPFLFP
jgi:hypothetical protein